MRTQGSRGRGEHSDGYLTTDDASGAAAGGVFSDRRRAPRVDPRGIPDPDIALLLNPRPEPSLHITSPVGARCGSLIGGQRVLADSVYELGSTAI